MISGGWVRTCSRLAHTLLRGRFRLGSTCVRSWVSWLLPRFDVTNLFLLFCFDVALTGWILFGDIHPTYFLLPAVTVRSNFPTFKMPFAKVKTGVSIHYELSTPTSSTAKAIDPKLPTLIFLHGVYIASVRSIQLETTENFTECANLQAVFHSELSCVSCFTHC